MVSIVGYWCYCSTPWDAAPLQKERRANKLPVIIRSACVRFAVRRYIDGHDYFYAVAEILDNAKEVIMIADW